MGCHDCVIVVRIQIPRQIFDHFPVDPVNRGLDGKPPVGAPQRIDGTEQPGGPLGNADIGVVDERGGFFTFQIEGIHECHAVPSALQFLCHGLSGRIVSAAHTAG